MLGESMIKLYICQTIDGFICDQDFKVDFLEQFNETILESKNDLIKNTYINFLKDIDTVIQGFRTYKSIKDLGYENAYREFENYVVTRNNLGYKDDTVTKFISLEELVKINFVTKNVFLVGGAQIIKEFLNLKMIDEIIIFNLPYFLGHGVRLFDHIDAKPNFELVEVISDVQFYQVHYKLIWDKKNK